MNTGLGVMLGLMLVILGYAIALAHLKTDRQEWRLVWLIGRVIRMGSALRAAGIPFDDEEPLPETDFPEPPSWYGRWRRRRARRAARAAKDSLIPPGPTYADARPDVVDAEVVDEQPTRTDTSPTGRVVESWAHAEESWGREPTAVIPAPDAADIALQAFRERMGDPRFTRGHSAAGSAPSQGDGGVEP